MKVQIATPLNHDRRYMEIIKSGLRSQNCKYGDFQIKPENGWEILQSFIDFESKLLIVSLSIIDRAKWINNWPQRNDNPSKRV